MKSIFFTSIRLVFLTGLIVLNWGSGFVYALEDDVWICKDDSEERNGDIRSAQDDRHYVYHDKDDQYAGFRFEQIRIPPGSVITSARLSFDERKKSNSNGISAQIYGEYTPTPSVFTTYSRDISNRQRTSANVYWRVKDKTTSDISEVIQEIINHPDWLVDSTIVLITKSNREKDDAYVRYGAEEQSNTGDRPQLYIEWSPAVLPEINADPVSLGQTFYIGQDGALSDSFVLEETSGDADFIGTITESVDWISSITIPNGGFTADKPLRADSSATITINYDISGLSVDTYETDIIIEGNAENGTKKVHITINIEEVPESAACGAIPLYAENIINPAIMVQLDTSGSMASEESYFEGDANPKTPSLVSIVQEIVNRPAVLDDSDGWEAGNDMAFVITGNGERRVYSYDGKPVDAPKLVVTYAVDGSPDAVVESQISAEWDDVQKDGSRDRIDPDEDYLELGDYYPVGLIFRELMIPNGATVTSAEIQFVPSATNSSDTDLVIYGIDKDTAPDFNEGDDLTRNYTTASVVWNDVEAWEVYTASRIEIAEDVLAEAFLDRNISWGFATWDGNNYRYPDYTRIRLGCYVHDGDHQEDLQEVVYLGSPGGYTPLGPTMHAGYEYFKGLRADEKYGNEYTPSDCQPRIVVLVTDGEGNIDSDRDTIVANVNQLLDEGISVVVVGFGLSEEDAWQAYLIAEIAQERGKDLDDDFLYPLHKEDANGKGIPYLAQSREEFIQAMVNITSSVKAQAFHGSAPAATTSADNGEVLISSTFNAAEWSGNLTATKFNYYTGALEETPLWTADEEMPDTNDISGWINDDISTSSVSRYTTDSIIGDNWLCKPLGDIINSTPKIVGKPAYWYRFDGYSTFKYNSEVYNRDALVYVAANDGALHAFDLDSGNEKWRFYPNAVIDKMDDMAGDATRDMCSTSYCHQFLFDGSPQAADIYNGTAWKTILVTGLGKGGSAYIGLDVTYANDFGTAASAEEGDTPSSVLWEFTDDELGLATAFPEIERVVDAGVLPQGSTWGTFFGSGAMENDILQETKEAYLFGINSWDASPLWLDSNSSPTFKVKLAPGSLPDDVAGPPLAVDLSDSALNNRVYITNMYGNMYRVADIGKGEQPNVDTFFYSGNSGHTTPALAKPAFAYYADADHDKLYDIWLYFGTGKYLDQPDKTSSDPQYFYGLLDFEGSSTGADAADEYAAYTPDDLITFSTSIVEGKAIDQDGNETGELTKYRTISCTPINDEGQCNPDNLSWKLALATGSPSERSINQPLVVAGIVFFVTFVPDGDVCEGNGDAWLFAVDYETGGFVSEAVFDINNDGVYDDSDKTVMVDGQEVGVAGIYLGQGKPTDPVIHGDVIFAGTSGMPPRPIKVNLPDGRARVKAWRQLFN